MSCNNWRSLICKFWTLSRKVRNAILHALFGNGSARAANRSVLRAKLWALCRKARNALVHALTGNGTFDF